MKLYREFRTQEEIDEQYDLESVLDMPSYAARDIMTSQRACETLVAMICGPIAMEAAPHGRTATVAGLIVGTGEIFGGGVATALAGHLAKTHGIASALTLAMGGLALGVIVGAFLKETAPRRKQLSETANVPV